jgi:Tol biopolymer transport system component
MRSSSSRARLRLLVGLVVGALACSAPAPEAHEVAGAASDGLVFARADGAQSDLWRARVADGAVRPFLTGAERAETWPYWADSTRRLVFQSERPPRGAGDLWLWEPGDRAPTPLTDTPARDERWPEWSPDGRRVAFAWRGGSPPTGIGWIELPGAREVAAAGSGPRDFFFRPSFAPDSQRLVAQRRGADGRGSTLWIVDAGGARRLTGGEGWFEQKPFFTRGGEAVVFSRQRGGEGPREIALVAAGPGAGARAAAPLPAAQPGADEHSARPSPARDELAFVSDRSGSRDVWLAPLAGGGAPRNLTATADRDEFAPRWSPDGERLVVTATAPQPPGRDGDRIAGIPTTLVVLDREGRILLETEGMMPDWMPPF